VDGRNLVLKAERNAGGLFPIIPTTTIITTTTTTTAGIRQSTGNHAMPVPDWFIPHYDEHF
jgi:hypothetical protein